MIWNINCRRTRRFLALWAGSDLEQRECQVAERHLAVCPKCREVWERLQQSQQVLERVRPAPLDENEQSGSVWPGSVWPVSVWPVSVWPVSVWPVSVWPGVSRQIRAMDERAVVSNWRDWLPAGAVAAACVGIISVTLTGVPRSESVSPSFIASSPANFDRVPRNFGSIPLGLHRVDLSRNERRPAPIDDDPPSF